MAVGILHKLIREGKFQTLWEVDSAGTWARGGQKVHPWTERILAESGIDISAQRSKEVTRELMEESDLVLTMEIGQAEALKLDYPDQAGKIAPLSALKQRSSDVADPVRGGEVEFRETYAVIEGYLLGSEEIINEWISTGNIQLQSTL